MNTEQKWIEAASHLAERLHCKQVDKAGADYFKGHLSFVASLGKTWQEKVVGYLHDAAEDTPLNVEQVIQQLEQEAKLSMASAERENIVQVLTLLNHHLCADRETYIRNIEGNPLARRVKMNDLKHNMDIHRLPAPTEKDYQRLERYKREYEYLSQIK